VNNFEDEGIGESEGEDDSEMQLRYCVFRACFFAEKVVCSNVFR
jgi:hypothetical protein